jgi:asparagine synthase (glutamine-hydrolysing)
MCGIAGLLDVQGEPIPELGRRLAAMNCLQAHRGPDGEGAWCHPRGRVGFAHRRLSIIDLEGGAQPMTDGAGNWIVFNGEIYNYPELRDEIGAASFTTKSDTEVILRAWQRWGEACLDRLRGMFAFAIWDEATGTLFCARDRFGIKPFYYTVADGRFHFASEAKALLPFVPAIETDLDAFRDYLAFQFCLDGKTLFRGISELLPGHCLRVRGGDVRVRRYWEVFYTLDFDHTPRYFDDRIQQLARESVALHLRADVPLGAYLSGGLDSSVVAMLAAEAADERLLAFNGRFLEGPEYDESGYAADVARHGGLELHVADITSADFVEHIAKVVYHLDYPVAGPGSFPQYMVSRLASRHRKVLLGGQGGDEIFGGYVRYLIAYFEQCIKAAIDGTMHSGNFIVTYESIIPNLTALRAYKPLLKEFWREGLFEAMDRRYFRLIDRAPELGDEINRDLLSDYSPFETFQRIFNGDNVGGESYFDRMTHFDFKTLLPALLQVEDRVSMAHGVESRVPLLDHPLVECAATMPSDVKFKDGTMKAALKRALGGVLPRSVAERTDKMGFPTPLNEWIRGGARDFVCDLLSTRAARERDLVHNRRVLEGLDREPRFGRKIWGLLSLEIWQQAFHDRASSFRRLATGD